MLLQLLFVLVAIIIGARLGGIGLGVMGGVGLAILTFVFGLQPTAPPIDVMLMIAAVISAASCMQAAGGLDYMVKIAERMLRKNPSHVTILAPFVTYFFTFLAGTGHVAYSVLPVIAEVAAETKIRPERPLGIAVIASQQGITASPISAATVALLGLLAGFDITLFDILKICVPATIIGILVGAFFSMRVGKELMDDPEYLRRLKDGMLEEKHVQLPDVKNLFNARLSVGLFIAATLLIVLFGSVPSLRPSFDGNALGMPILIEILMLSAAALILLLTKTDGIKATQGSIFKIPVLRCDLINLINELKENNFKVLATSLNTDNEIKDIKNLDKFAIVFGNEANGVKQEVFDLVDETFKIKMYNDVESLNVAIACAICIYHLS